MTDDLMRKLRIALPALRPSERRVADAVLEEPAATVDLTITELAERCHTSMASVVRFCRSLGFSGYSDFRLALASSVGGEQVSLGRFGFADSEITAQDPVEDVVAKIAFHEARDIEATAAGMDLVALDQAAHAIAEASRIDVYGVASSAISATDLHQKLHRIGLISHSWSDIHLALTSAATLSEGSVAIGFSHSGQTVEMAEVIAAASARGATTVLITNFPSSPIARMVDHVLATSVTETRYRPGAMSGRLAQLVVVDFIFTRIAQLLSGRTETPLELSFDAVQSHRLDYGRPLA